MITRENLTDVIAFLSHGVKRAIKRSNKEYCILFIDCLNTGCIVTVKLTDDYDKYNHVSDDGNAILYVDDVQQIIEEEI